MTFQKNAFVFLILIVAFTHVASWTIDLPEVRKFLFEKTEAYKKYNKNEYDDYLNSDQKYYSNIEGNSKHNSDHYKHEHHSNEKENYAEEYGYQNYMAKKVHNIVSDGSTYLEGLRRSLEDYSMFLESCNRQNASRQNSTTSSNSTSWRPEFDFPFNSSTFASPSNNSEMPMLNFQNYENSTVPMRPKPTSETRRPEMRSRSNRRMTCEEATRSSEQVRRYADLALHATKRLQDLAYAKKYQKTDEQEENELILKLAWFLDRLAYLSGYEPDYKFYEPSGTKTIPTLPPTPPTLVPSSEEMNREMMDCLKGNSSEPATVRCRYTGQIPELMQQMLSGGTTESSNPSNSNSVLPMSRPSDNVAEQSSEILITADNCPNSLPSSSPRITKRAAEYTYYFPAKPVHELAYPVPIVKLIKHRLSNIKSVVKTIVERRLAHLAEKKEHKDHVEKEHFEKHHFEQEHFEKHHFEKRSIDEDNSRTTNFVTPLTNNPKYIDKSIEKRNLDDTPLIHYPISDVSVINTKSFKKRSIDERRVTSNHINRLSNLKSIVKSVEKGPIMRKKFEYFLSPTKIAKRLSKYPNAEIKSLKKRYTDDPLSKLANYYIKYKVWENSNPIYPKKNFNKKASIFDVKNHLNEPKVIQKRSLFNKKVVHMHIPKPIQVVRTYIQGHKHHHMHSIHKPKLLTHLHKLHELKHKKVEKIHKNIKKRSLHYEHMYLPRYPMDPQGDISYYIKNKEGTNFNPNPVQAAQVRAGLEQVFQTGNIEIVRRFGSNYNPLNPAPFYSGIIATNLDS